MYTLKGRPDKIAKAAGGVGARREAPDEDRDQGRRRPDRRSAREAAGRGRQGHAQAQQEGPDRDQQARAQAVGGYNVWRSWDEPGGIRDELHNVADQNPQIVKLEVLGKTHQGRDLIALKLAQGASSQPDGSRPAVLYSSNQHAREWISLEVNRRLMHYFIDGWRANNAEIRNLLKTPSCGSSSRRTRTVTSTRSTTSACGARTCATTTATGRSPSATESTPTATSRSTGATTTRGRRRIRRRDLPRSQSPGRSPRPRPCRT